MLGTVLGLSPRRLFAIGLVIAAGLLAILLIVLWQVGVFDSAPPPAALESAIESLEEEEDQGATRSSEPADQARQQQESAQQSADQGGSPGAQTEDQAQVAEQEQPQQESSPQQEQSVAVTDDDYGASYQQTQAQLEPEPQDSQDAQPQPAQQQSEVAEVAEVAPPTLQSLSGTWTISTRGSSFVGYRIGEELANIGTATAVGRTSDIEATLVFDGSAISSVVITADLRTLESDQSFRDSALRTRGIETDTYPFATFTLSEPIPIDALPSAESPLSVTVTGTLELHGVTNAVSIGLQGQYVDGLVVVAGSTEIALAEYDIEKPTGFRVLSIEDIGIMEFELVFERQE